MTGKQWHEELSKYGDDIDIILMCEEEGKIRYFDIIGLSLQKGTPSRDEDNNPQFSFDSEGLSKKLFISITPDF